ncbi:hypothetical protein GIB67_004996 [Kingdonia uniflora]|uniref:RNase H type-1 domain-containing protein n=1 Tax=Kingdonia uniflora TaxID=39325 RepID=A0A7J7NN85_9MAGN|nr:hypothetical protein GIB67_004996 [Kingdonia uniflora]
MSRIKTSIAQLASGLSTRDKGTFPSQTQPNPKDQTESLHRDQANAVITVRSGKTVDNKVRMPEDKSHESPNPSTEKVVEGGKPICEETPFVEEETEQMTIQVKTLYNVKKSAFADLLKAKPTDLSTLPIPTMRGDIPAIHISEAGFLRGVEHHKFSLIGRLDLMKVKHVVARTEAMSKWSPAGNCQFIPLGKGYFTILLDNESDKLRIWSGGPWHIEVSECQDVEKSIEKEKVIHNEADKEPKKKRRNRKKPNKNDQEEKEKENQKKDGKLKEVIVDKTPSTQPASMNKKYKGVVEMWDKTTREWDGSSNSRDVDREACMVNQSWADMVEEGDGTSQITDEGVEIEDGSRSESNPESGSNSDTGISYQTQEAEEWHNVLSRKNIRKNKSKANCSYIRRRHLWNDLSVFGTSNLPWLVETSGQVFTSEKSKLYLGAMTNVKKQKFKDILGFDEGCLPTTYLGIPLVQERVGVRGALEDVSAHSGWVIGDGKCIDLWRDNWCSPLSLKDIINDDAIPWTDLNAKELPNHGEIKINTDAAARGNPGKGGIVYIFRDSEGKILGSFAQGLGLVSNYTAECKAIIKGVDLAALNGWLIAWVESDSKAAVEAFHSDNIPWILEAEWANVK